MSRWITIEAAEAAVKAVEEENTRLKAEVERLKSIHSIDSIGTEYLKAQVERLTKAGDNLEQILASRISSYEVGNASREWNAAKVGFDPK